MPPGTGRVEDKTRICMMQDSLQPKPGLAHEYQGKTYWLCCQMCVQAFQGDPLLLILDEPTEGLDPLMQEALYALLFEVRKRGRTVFMSSHVLSEVERVCDRIALLRQGEVVVLSTVEEVRRLAARRVRVVFEDDVEYAASRLPAGSELIESQPREWRLHVHGPLGPLLGALRELPVKDMQVQEAHLEDILMKYYREGTQ